MKKDKLIPKDVNHGGMEDLSDSLYLIAREIEKTFSIIEAVPGEDYTKKDLVEMAVEFAAQTGANFAIDTGVYK